MQALPTGVYGPLPKETLGLTLGRSSATMKSISVSPGIVDENFTGEIKIMTSSPSGISVIQNSQRIAQLILLPSMRIGKVVKQYRGEQGFGSSDAYWLQEIKSGRPELVQTIRGKQFKGLLDTGADVTCISQEHWPKNWPCVSSMTQLQGTGQNQSPMQSADILSWKDADGALRNNAALYCARSPS